MSWVYDDEYIKRRITANEFMAAEKIKDDAKFLLDEADRKRLEREYWIRTYAGQLMADLMKDSPIDVQARFAIDTATILVNMLEERLK